MMQRVLAGKPAEITFTCDFHELVAGDLRPDAPLLLRYDPHRIVPAGEPYRFGDPDRPVTAHVYFRDGAPRLDLALRSPAGIIPCPDVDLTGQGSMLSASLVVPSDADLLIIWFSYRSAEGTVHYDSDYGVNYRFGFPSREIDVVQAEVSGRRDGTADRFDLVVRAAPEVEGVTLQYFLTVDPTCAKRDIRLQRANHDVAHPEMVRWAAYADIPHRAIVRFRLCYWIGGRRLIDDNTGAWYLSPQPHFDQAPPPSAALLEAAAAWRSQQLLP
jgi:hypothetical protein